MKPKGLVLVLALLLVGGAGAGAAWVLKPHTASAAKEPPPPPPVQATVAEVTTNLADTGARRYVQVELTVDLEGEEAAKAFNDKMPAVRDAVIGVLRSRTSDELAGADGKSKLAADLKAAIEGALGGDRHVLHVYFTRFVIQ